MEITEEKVLLAAKTGRFQRFYILFEFNNKILGSYIDLEDFLICNGSLEEIKKTIYDDLKENITHNLRSSNLEEFDCRFSKTPIKLPKKDQEKIISVFFEIFNQLLTLQFKDNGPGCFELCPKHKVLIVKTKVKNVFTCPVKGCNYTKIFKES